MQQVPVARSQRQGHNVQVKVWGEAHEAAVQMSTTEHPMKVEIPHIFFAEAKQVEIIP